MQIILVKYIQLFCVTLFFSNNIKCDQLLFKNDNEDQRIYGISACTGRCIKSNINLTLEECYESCVEFALKNDLKQPKKVYHNLEMKFICRDDTSFVLEIVSKNFHKSNNENDNNNDDQYLLNIDEEYFYDNEDEMVNDTQPDYFRHDDDNNNNYFEVIDENERIFYENLLSKQKENYKRNDDKQFQIFVIKIYEEDKFPIEKKVYLTNSSLIRLDNLQPNTKYHLSAASVYPNDEYTLIANEVSYSTLKKKYIPRDISDIKVNYKPDNENLNVISAEITWEPAVDQTCYYDIVVYPDTSNRFDLNEIPIRDIEQLYTYTLRNLTFGTEYKIAIRGKNIKDRVKESELSWQSLSTPTCLDWYKNTTICPPEIPEILNVTEIYLQKNDYDIYVEWKKQKYLPIYYQLMIIDMKRNDSIETNVLSLNISKNCTSILLPKVTLYGTDFRVNLTAYSDSGSESTSVFVPIDFSNYKAFVNNNYQTLKLILSIVLPMSSLALTCMIVLIIYIRRTKLKRFKDRCKYFESLKKKTPIDINTGLEICSQQKSTSCGIDDKSFLSSSIAIIDVDQLQSKLQEKLYIDDEKEIDREKLNLCEILGEGAFGRVYRGILKTENNKTMEVAVKMIKDQPSCEDIKAFRREIDVMKSVGIHPNIVGIIGHYTKNINELMLLTEYCSLGNLENFLRSEWRYLNKITFQKSNLSPKTPTNCNLNEKHQGNIFNYNNSMIEKNEIHYKNVLRNDEKLQSTLSLNTITGENVKNPITNENMLVINKGYELNNPCTNSCKCKVDIIPKKLSNSDENGNDDDINLPKTTMKNDLKMINDQQQYKNFDIEIKNCDCYNNTSSEDKPKLKSLINQNHEFLTSADLLLIAKQIAMGMEFLAKNRVVHRDLAARNVLVCDDRTVKIADFGLSRDVYQENIYKKTGSGKLPIKWLALESMTHQVYTSQSDVWSFGILLYEIVTLGGTPYPTVSNNQLLNLLKNGYRMQKPRTCSEEIYNLMSKCWKTNSNERPTFTEIIKILDELLVIGNPDNHIFSLIPFEKRMKTVSEESYLTPINSK